MCFNKVPEPELWKMDEMEEENIIIEEDLRDLGHDEVRFIRYDNWHLEEGEELVNMETDVEEGKNEDGKKEEKSEEEEEPTNFENDEAPMVNIFRDWIEVLEEDWPEVMEMNEVDEKEEEEEEEDDYDDEEIELGIEVTEALWN